MSSLPDLENLHLRHFGLTPAVCASHAEAARVLLDSHGNPPATVAVGRYEASTVTEYTLDWRRVTVREQAAWFEITDATEAAAYSVAISAAEAELELFAVQRVPKGRGADYWVQATPIINLRDGLLDLENAIRFEVTGIEVDRGATYFLRRLSKKVDQIKAGGTDGGWAVAVSFPTHQVSFRYVAPSPAP